MTPPPPPPPVPATANVCHQKTHLSTSPPKPTISKTYRHLPRHRQTPNLTLFQTADAPIQPHTRTPRPPAPPTGCVRYGADTREVAAIAPEAAAAAAAGGKEKQKQNQAEPPHGRSSGACELLQRRWRGRRRRRQGGARRGAGVAAGRAGG